MNCPSSSVFPVNVFVAVNVIPVEDALYVLVNTLFFVLSFFSSLTLNTGSEATNVPVPLSVTVIVYVSSLSEYVIFEIFPAFSVTLKL